jgi:hypothetical protein
MLRAITEWILEVNRLTLFDFVPNLLEQITKQKIPTGDQTMDFFISQ